jgi:hypothetical protein
MKRKLEKLNYWSPRSTFWNNKKIPILLYSCQNLKASNVVKTTNIYTHPNCYQINYKYTITRIEPFFFDISKNEEGESPTSRNYILETINQWPSHRHIYTDASKCPDRHYTASALYDSKVNVAHSFQLNSLFTIFSAEVITILHTLYYIENLQEKTFLILLNSKTL